MGSVEAWATRNAARLEVGYRIEGDLARVRIPPPRPPAMGDKLWRHTCCEIFVARKGQPAYHEFNFSPSGQWAAHAFARYRDGGPLSDETLKPEIAVRCAPHRLELDAAIGVPAADKLCVGLCVVVEDGDGAISYWALRHAPGKPDFHHPEAFALEL